MSDVPNNQIPGLKQKKVFKIIVLGDSGVGKTCLTYRFCEGQFLDKSEATIGVDFRERNIKIGGEDIKLQLWDTAGQERFRKSMVQHYYRNVHAVVIVYDVTKPETFHSIASWMQEVESHGLMRAPRVLVGNKCDCGTPESRLATTYAQRLADKYGMPESAISNTVVKQLARQQGDENMREIDNNIMLGLRALSVALSMSSHLTRTLIAMSHPVIDLSLLFETSALLDSECDNVESIFMTLAHKLYSKQPLRVVSVEGENGPGLVNLQRQKRSTSSNDSCLCS